MNRSHKKLQLITRTTDVIGNIKEFLTFNDHTTNCSDRLNDHQKFNSTQMERECVKCGLRLSTTFHGSV